MDLVTYFLPKSRYFTEGWRGRVTHALGVAAGLAREGRRVNLVSGPGTGRYSNSLPESIRKVEVPRPPGLLFSELRWRRNAASVVEGMLPESNVLLIRYAISRPLSLVRLAGVARTQGVFTVLEINSLAFHHLGRLPQSVQWLVLRWEATVASRFDAIYVVSRRVGAALRKAGSRTPILTVPNAAARTSPAAEPRSEEGVGRCRFVYAGVFQPYYDFEVLLEAYRRVREADDTVSLHFHGGGGREEALLAAAADHRDVVFHGRFDRNELPSMIRLKSDVLVLPVRETIWAEIGSPTKLFEYMSLGVPVVAARVGEAARVLEHGVTAYLYPPGDAGSLASLLTQIASDPLGRRAIGRRARERFLAVHTWEHRMRKLMVGVKRICGQERRRHRR